MAKRMADNRVWKKQWYRELTPKMKATLKYLEDNCDHAGLWDIDMGELCHKVNDSVTMDEILTAFNADKTRFLVVGKKLYRVGFPEFQYKVKSLAGLSPNSKVHRSVLDLLEKAGVFEALRYSSPESLGTLTEPLANPLPVTLQDKEKDKEKDKDQEKEKEKAKAKDKESLEAKIERFKSKGAA